MKISDFVSRHLLGMTEGGVFEAIIEPGRGTDLEGPFSQREYFLPIIVRTQFGADLSVKLDLHDLGNPDSPILPGERDDPSDLLIDEDIIKKSLVFLREQCGGKRIKLFVEPELFDREDSRWEYERTCYPFHSLHSEQNTDKISAFILAIEGIGAVHETFANIYILEDQKKMKLDEIRRMLAFSKVSEMDVQFRYN